jgi:hypothetical protein
VKKNAPAVLPSDLSPNCLLAMVEEFNKTSHGLIMTLVCIYLPNSLFNPIFIQYMPISILLVLEL